MTDESEVFVNDDNDDDDDDDDDDDGGGGGGRCRLGEHSVSMLPPLSCCQRHTA